jgi:hypothetical protein
MLAYERRHSRNTWQSMCVCVRVCALYIYVYVYIYIYMYIYIYIYIYGVKYFSTFNETLEYFNDI